MPRKRAAEVSPSASTPEPEPREERAINEWVSEWGTVTFTEGVLTALVHQALSDVEGLGEVKGKLTDLVGLFGGRQKGIQVALNPDGVHVTLSITVRYGKPIHEVARTIQKRVKEEVERMTGLSVSGVDIYVQDIQPPEPPAPVPEEAPEEPEEPEQEEGVGKEGQGRGLPPGRGS